MPLAGYVKNAPSQNKIVWFSVITSIVIIGLVLGVHCFEGYRLEMRLLDDRLMAQARVIDENLNTNLSAISLLLENIKQETIKNSDHHNSQLNKYLKKQVYLASGIRTILVTDSQGRCINSNRDILIGKNFSDRDYFSIPRDTADRTQTFISQPFRSSLGRFVINISKPVIGKQGEFNGIVTVSLEPEYFQTLLQSTVYAPDNRIALIHADGTVFASIPGGKSSIVGQNLLKPDSRFFQHIRDGRPTSIQSGRSKITGDNRVFAFITNEPKNLRIDKHFVVGASRNLNAVLASWKTDTITELSLYLLFSGLIIVTTRKMLRRGIEFDKLQAVQESILESAGEGILGLDRSGTILFCNQAAARLTGMSCSQLIGQNYHQSLHNDNSGHNTTDCPVKLTLRDGVSRSVIDCVLANQISVEQTITPLFEHNKTVGVVIIIRDVTEQRKIVSERARIAEFDRALLDSLNSNIAILDRDGTIISVNVAWKEFANNNRTGDGELPRCTNIGSNYIKVCQEASGEFSEQSAEALGGICAVLNGSATFFSLEYSCHSPDTKRWFIMNVEPLRIPEGGAVVSHTNITKRKLIDLELKESRERYNILFENAGDAIMILDTNGCILSANRVLCQRLGYAEDELRGKTPAMFSTPQYAEKVSDRLNLIVASGEEVFESEHLAKNGTVIQVEINSRVINVSSQTILLSIVRDITLRKRMDEELRQALETATDTNMVMRRLLNIVAHEFRTPLSLLTASTDILARYFDRLSQEKIIEQAGFIKSAAVKISNLVDAVISYNQLGVDRPLQLTMIPDIDDLCRTVATEIEVVWSSGQKFDISMDIDNNEILLDELLFRRILENLLTNAFRYTPVAESVTLHVRLEETELLVEIIDTGIGIPEADQMRIFEPFFCIGSVSGPPRLGLGLSIVKDALTQIGGTIIVESTIGKGTTMRVKIPVTG
jgi:PAS domain S-box-containing protein